MPCLLPYITEGVLSPTPPLYNGYSLVAFSSLDRRTIRPQRSPAIWTDLAPHTGEPNDDGGVKADALCRIQPRAQCLARSGETLHGAQVDACVPEAAQSRPVSAQPTQPKVVDLGLFPPPTK
jgi:hypothetical protein